MAVSPQHFTEVDGLRVQFRLRGDASGAPLIMLHGWGQNSLSFVGVSGALEERFRILTPDLPGFGFSDTPSQAWGSSDYARVVAELIKTAGFESADVLGHSRGGTIALALATAYPELVRRLVIVASPIVRLPPEPGARRTSFGFSVVRGLAKLLPPLRERILNWGRERFGSADYKAAGAMRPTLVRVVNEDWRPALPSIRAPVLLIWGSEDAEVPPRVAQEAEAELPNARSVTLEGAGHFPFLDKPEPFAEAVVDFLTETHD